MPDSLTFDHAVLVVRGLRAASRDYVKLGFQVLPGGRHAGGQTRNALVPLADGSYLELLAPARPGLRPLLRARRRLGRLDSHLARQPPFPRYFARHLTHNEGLVDFALHCPDLPAALNRAKGAGLHFDGPYPGGRTRPDGQELAWTLAFPRRGDPRMAGLPFLIQDQTPRALRVPEAPPHPNGAQGIARLTLCLPDPQTWARSLTAILGQPPSSDDGTVSFSLGSVHLTAQPTATAAPPQLYLHSPTRTGPLNLTQAHGARIRLV